MLRTLHYDRSVQKALREPGKHIEIDQEVNFYIEPRQQQKNKKLLADRESRTHITSSPSTL